VSKTLGIIFDEVPLGHDSHELAIVSDMTAEVVRHAFECILDVSNVSAAGCGGRGRIPQRKTVC
jgi:hypothetical protein